MLVRIPVFVFQGLATSLLPNLTRLQASGGDVAFRGAVRRAAVVLAACGAAIVAAAVAVGPEAMQLVYGQEYVAGRLELGLLAAGVGCYLATATFSQALLALDAGRAAAAGWCVCATVFVGSYALVDGDALFRVSVAFAAGTAVGVPLLARSLRRRRPR
jgi:O-antigen/teichoic acid export membrane protein